MTNQNIFIIENQCFIAYSEIKAKKYLFGINTRPIFAIQITIQMKNNTPAAMLTDTQIRQKTNAYLASKGLPNWVKVRIIRGTYHIDNIGNYFAFASAATILHQATGLMFESMTISMARRKA